MKNLWEEKTQGQTNKTLEEEKRNEEILRKFLQENPLNLDVPRRKETVDTLKNSKHKEILGDYVIASDFELKTEGTKIVLSYKNNNNQLLVLKEVSKKKFEKLGQLNRWENLTEIEEYLKEKEFNDPNVILPEAIIKKGDTLYRFYEALDVDLEKYLETHNQLSINESVSLILNACQGVEALHKANVINIDFAPLNIMLTQKKVKLIDIDYASICKNASGICSKNSVGNNRFTSPPELFEKEPVFNKTVDTYAISSTLYRLIAGDWPYNIEKEIEHLTHHSEKQAAYKELHKLRKINFPSSIPLEIQEVIKKGMSPNPLDRYQSVKEFMFSLLEAYSKYEKNIPYFVQKEMPLDSVPSETLLKNNLAELDPSFEIENYFQKQDPNYIKQLELLNSKIEIPMQKETKVVVCIPIASHQEFNNIYKTLESYAKQNANKKEFEVLLFVNAPEKAEMEKKEEINKTMSEIKRAKNEFPELQIRVAQAFLPQDQVKIGNIRKIGTDLALLRQKNAKIKEDLILLSNDADNQGVSDEYVDSYIKYFKENPEKEGAVGNLQYDPNAFIRFPIIHVQQEFATFLDQVGFENGNVTLLGNNSCMKSSIYAAIGGVSSWAKNSRTGLDGKNNKEIKKKEICIGFC